MERKINVLVFFSSSTSGSVAISYVFRYERVRERKSYQQIRTLRQETSYQNFYNRSVSLLSRVILAFVERPCDYECCVTSKRYHLSRIFSRQNWKAPCPQLTLCNTSLQRKGFLISHSHLPSYSFSALRLSPSVSACLKRNQLFTYKYRRITLGHSSTIFKTRISVFVVWYRVMIYLCSNNTIVTDSAIISEISKYLFNNRFVRGLFSLFPTFDTLPACQQANPSKSTCNKVNLVSFAVWFFWPSHGRWLLHS